MKRLQHGFDFSLALLGVWDESVNPSSCVRSAMGHSPSLLTHHVSEGKEEKPQARAPLGLQIQQELGSAKYQAPS